MNLVSQYIKTLGMYLIMVLFWCNYSSSPPNHSPLCSESIYIKCVILFIHVFVLPNAGPPGLLRGLLPGIAEVIILHIMFVV